MPKLAILLILLFALTGCKSYDDPPETKPRAVTSRPVEPSGPDAFDMMETVFIGGHSRIQIQNRLNLVFDLYNTPKTEENYNRAGSVLVELRKNSEIPEMDILNCMKQSAGILAGKSFPEAAAYCVTAMY